MKYEDIPLGGNSAIEDFEIVGGLIRVLAQLHITKTQGMNVVLYAKLIEYYMKKYE